MAKNKLDPHVEYLDECLSLLRQKIGENREYLDTVRWQDLQDENREREFKFQAELMTKYVSWLNEYARLSGIVEAFQEMTGAEDKEVRKGSFKSSYAEMIKEGKFDE